MYVIRRRDVAGGLSDGTVRVNKFNIVYPIAQKSSEIDWSQYWSPKLFIENVIGEVKETITKTVSFDANARATIYEKRRVNGTFQEFMELYQFPFDTQVCRNMETPVFKNQDWAIP